MTPRVVVTGLVLLILAVAVSCLILWLSHSGKKLAAPERAPSAPSEEKAEGSSFPPANAPAATAPAVAEPEEPAVVLPPGPPPANPPATRPQPGEPVQAAVHNELESVGTVIRDFRNALGGNPVGTNAEITSALLGDNPKQTSFDLPPGSAVNEQGEMVDRWSTPYFFHQISGVQMEIRSAGPDRRMWTSDDVVGR